ncbi:amino acid/polyamine transporter I [Cunninghamella echinulata]|nr:amino acid/polyamine transporter I [Cunninghamella echinulata]
MMNIGQIIGTGIFSNPALILQNTGSGGMVLILWVVGALTATSGLAVFMELGTMLPRSAAEKEYLAYTYPNPRQLIAFVFMIMVGVISRGAGIAQGATVFGNNIVFAIAKGTNDWQARGFGAFCITFWILVNIFSAKNAVRFNNFFTVLKITLLLLLICVGFAGLAGRLPNQPNLKENFSFQGTINNAGSYANAIYYVIFSYGGYYNLQKVTDELKDPIKNLPRCGVASVAFTTVLYLLANVAYLAVLPLEVIANSNLTVAANLFSTAFGGIFGTKVLPVFVGLSSFGFVGVVTYSGSRVILEFARQGHLPFDRFFSRLHPKYQTPIPALLLLYVIALIFLLAPPPGTAFQFIMAFSGYGDYFFAALCGIALLILRRREPELKRYIRAPIPLVLFYLAVCAFTLIFVYIPPTKAPSAYPYWGN